MYLYMMASMQRKGNFLQAHRPVHAENQFPFFEVLYWSQRFTLLQELAIGSVGETKEAVPISRPSGCCRCKLNCAAQFDINYLLSRRFWFFHFHSHDEAVCELAKVVVIVLLLHTTVTRSWQVMYKET